MINMCKKNVKIVMENGGLNVIGIEVFFALLFVAGINGIEEIMSVYTAAIIRSLGAYYLGVNAMILSVIVIGVLNRVDRENSINQVILSDGIKSYEIVFSRFFSTMFILYIAIAAQFIFMCVYCNVSKGEVVKLDLHLLISCFLFFPIVVMAINGVAILLLLISRKASFLLFVVQFGLSTTLMILGIGNLSGEFKVNLEMTIIATIISLFVNVGVFIISKRIPNELIVIADTK